MHIALAGLGATPAQNDRAAATPIGAGLLRHDVDECGEDRFHGGVNGGIVGVERRGEARVHHAAVAHLDVEGAHQAAVDENMRIDERDETVGDCAAHQRRADVGGAGGLVVAAGEVEGDLVTFLLDDDMDAHGLVEAHAVVIDEALGLVAAIVPFGDGGLHAQAGQLEQAVEALQRLVLAELGDEFTQALFAQPARPELAANVAQHEFRRAAVGGDDALDLGVAREGALVAHGRQVQAFVEGLLRLARTGARHRAADVALVGDGAAESDQRAIGEDRRDDAHVGRVRTATLIVMVDEEGIAFRDVVVFAQHCLATGRERADMQWQHNVLGHHVANGIHDGAGGILAFAHDG